MHERRTSERRPPSERCGAPIHAEDVQTKVQQVWSAINQGHCICRDTCLVCDMTDRAHFLVTVCTQCSTTHASHARGKSMKQMKDTMAGSMLSHAMTKLHSDRQRG
jgi:hypothetical protein